MLNAVSKLGNKDGLFAFMKTMSDLLDDNTTTFRGKKIKKINDEFFTTATSSATGKDMNQIQSLFIPFKNDYMLSNMQNELNIDFESIVNDNEHYHCLNYSWIEDKKMRYFVILYFLTGIIGALKNANKPVCIMIDEIRHLVPDKPEGFVKFLSETIKEALSTLRNMGRGVTVIAGTQEFFDVEEDVRNSFSRKLFGRLCQADIERLSKTHAWNQAMRQMFTSMKMNHYHWLGYEDTDEFTILFPPHPHKEPPMNFFELYHKYFPFNEKKYDFIYESQKMALEIEMLSSKESAEKKQRILKDELKRIEEERIKSTSAVKKLEEIKEEKRKEVLSEKEETMKKCYDLYISRIKEFTKIAEMVGGISSPTAKSYIIKYQQKLGEVKTDVKDNMSDVQNE
jgi:hypothetical protein